MTLIPDRPAATPACMIQGTGSDVGKSVIVAGLCHAFSRRGIRVLPFKPQNMSNNAAVTADGGEIGRAQALQALAAGVEPSVDMNPVLLKPQSDQTAQVVVHGRVRGIAGAGEYQDLKLSLLPAVLQSFDRLCADADLVLVEGAGSPAEINLRAGDIANMGFAEAANVPVILAGDIDRGGVIASLTGTHLLLPENERTRIKGFIINKFRGDVRLFDGGLTAIIERTGWNSLGVLPYVPEVRQLPAEDTFDSLRYQRAERAVIRVAVPMLARIANFDDVDPLAAEPGVSVEMIPPGTALPGDADLVFLPGSKSTLSDLAFFRAQGWDIDLKAHIRRGGSVLGVCAGYQMLGRSLVDHTGVDGVPGQAEGLGYLNVSTELTADKTLRRVTGIHDLSGEALTGYEMHVGETRGPDTLRAFLTLEGRGDGAISPDGRVAGCYVHGLFASDDFRRAYLDSFRTGSTSVNSYQGAVDNALGALADTMEDCLDLESILGIAVERGK